MGKCQNSKRSGRTLPELLSFGEWVLVFAALTQVSQSSLGCYRVIGRVARRPLKVGVQQVGDAIQPIQPIVPRSKSLPNLAPKPKRPNPMDREPSDVINIAQTDAIHHTKSLEQTLQSSWNSMSQIASPNSKSTLDLQSSGSSPALPISRNSMKLSSPQSAPLGTRFRSRLQERVRNGGRSFSRALGSFPSYSRRTMRSIHTRWGRIRVRHPAAVRYAKWVSWLSGIAASVGSAVSLPVELYRTFHALNQSDEDIRNKIQNVTAYLEDLQDQSEKEFQDFPDQTIYDLYHRPLRRDERGVYRLGFEDLPRSEEDPTVMDPTFQDIPGFPPEIEEAEQAMRTTTMATSTSTELILQTPQRRTNQVSHLEKGFTLADATLNATRSPSISQDSALEWFEVWGGMTPKLLGWIILAMVGFIILLTYAAFVLCVRKCCAFLRNRMSQSNSVPEDYTRALPRSLPPEHVELNQIPLDGFSNVNLYEVIPVAQPIVAEPPVPAVPLSPSRD